MQSHIAKRFIKTEWRNSVYYQMTDCYHMILFVKFKTNGTRFLCVCGRSTYLIEFNHNMFSKILYSSAADYLTNIHNMIKAVKLSLLLSSLKRINLRGYHNAMYNVLHLIKIFKHKSITYCDINAHKYFTNHLIVFIL